MLLPNEVDDGEHRLLVVLPQSPADLLGQNRRGLCRAKQKDCVHGWDVDAFAEDIDAEDAPQITAFEEPKDAFPLHRVRLAGQGGAGQPPLGERPSHELRVGDGHAEPQRAHRAGVEQDALELAEQADNTGVVAGVETVQVFGAIPAASPLERREIDVVVDAEVLEGREMVILDRLPQAQLGSGPTPEPPRDVLSVHALGRRGQPEQLIGLEVLEQRPVARRRRVVDLVDDHDVVGVRGERLDRLVAHRLHHREDVSPALRAFPVAEQLAEMRVLQHRCERRATLIEDPSAVRDEQQRQISSVLRAEAPVVQRCHHGLAGSGRRHQQISVAVMAVTLDLQLLEQALLVVERMDVERHVPTADRRTLRVPLPAERRLEPLRVLIRVVALKRVVTPVRLEGRAHAVNERSRFALAETHVPFEALVQRGEGHVRRSEERGGQAARSVQQPRLGVQLCPIRVVGDAHLSTGPYKFRERFGLGCPHVRRCDDAQAAVAFDEVLELVQQSPHAAPDHEADEQIDPDRTRQFALQLLTDRGLPVAVDEQFVRGERDRWTGREVRVAQSDGRGIDARQEIGRQSEEVSLIGLAGGEKFDRAVDDACLVLGRGGAIVETAKDALGHCREVAGETVGRVGRFELAAMDEAVVQIAQRVPRRGRQHLVPQPRRQIGHGQAKYWCIALSVC